MLPDVTDRAGQAVPRLARGRTQRRRLELGKRLELERAARARKLSLSKGVQAEVEALSDRTEQTSEIRLELADALMYGNSVIADRACMFG